MSKPQNPKKDVLVADGVGFYRRMMVELLSAQGYRVTEAETIDDAIEQIQREHPDLVLLDAELPGGGAAAFLDDVKKHEIRTFNTVAILPPTMDENMLHQLQELGVGACVPRSAPIDDILVAASTVLFPQGKNLRRSPRAQVHIPVTYTTDETAPAEGFITAETFNLSADGMFVVTPVRQPSEPGSKLYMKFWVPGAERILEVEGVVIWCNQAGNRLNELYPPGMGVMFLGLPREEAAVLNEYVRIRSMSPLR